MTNDEIDRLNTLTDKTINAVATVDELKEFNQLLTVWSEDEDLNFLNEHHAFRVRPK